MQRSMTPSRNWPQRLPVQRMLPLCYVLHGSKLADRSLFSVVTRHQKTFNRQSANALFVLAQVYQMELPVNMYLFQV